jgi:hypothetical protein
MHKQKLFVISDFLFSLKSESSVLKVQKRHKMDSSENGLKKETAFRTALNVSGNSYL